MFFRRGQGAFEYLLLLGGTVLVATVAVVMTQGSVYGANDTLNETTTDYLDYVSAGVANSIASPSPVSVNGMCGTSNGGNFYSIPVSGLCSNGSASAVTGSGPWYWSCVGAYGGSEGCSANLAVNGTCGSSNGANLFYAPTNLCSAGSASAVSGSGPWSWTCAGSNSGTTASCSANLAVNGVCGSSNGANVYSVPTSNFCLAGSASLVSGSGPWSWFCNGSYGGTNASCSANLVVNGVCGSSSGANLYAAPYSNFCSAGNASSLSGSGPWSWSCNGSNGGSSASCSANLAVNGACGSSSGANFYSVPTSNFCNSGSASSVSGSGPWVWSCNGSYGGTNASCSANKAVNGVCGSSNGASSYSAPSSNLCSAGTASSVSGSGPWSWTCAGISSGTNASCSSLLTVNGVCGSSSGQPSIYAPTTSLCSTGSASAVSGSGPWSWSCSGTNGGSSTSCSATKLMLVNNVHSYAACLQIGGAIFLNASTAMCRLSGAACPSGWTRYMQYGRWRSPTCSCQSPWSCSSGPTSGCGWYGCFCCEMAFDHHVTDNCVTHAQGCGWDAPIGANICDYPGCCGTDMVEIGCY